MCAGISIGSIAAPSSRGVSSRPRRSSYTPFANWRLSDFHGAQPIDRHSTIRHRDVRESRLPASRAGKKTNCGITACRLYTITHFVRSPLLSRDESRKNRFPRRAIVFYNSRLQMRLIERLLLVSRLWSFEDNLRWTSVSYADAQSNFNLLFIGICITIVLIS